jgi:predicted outer membrane lipoprotein
MEMEHLILRRDGIITFLVCTVLALAFGVVYSRWQRHMEILAIK